MYIITSTVIDTTIKKKTKQKYLLIADKKKTNYIRDE